MAFNDLAELYRAEGKSKEPEPLYQQSIALWEKVTGPGQRNIGIVLENYAASSPFPGFSGPITMALESGRFLVSVPNGGSDVEIRNAGAV
jgi:hypothetical protein